MSVRQLILQNRDISATNHISTKLGESDWKPAERAEFVCVLELKLMARAMPRLISRRTTQEETIETTNSREIRAMTTADDAMSSSCTPRRQ